MTEIKIKINNKEILGQEGQTILEVAKANGIEIPTLCYHSDLEGKASCRVCIVEICQNNGKSFNTACSTQIREGMEITTDTPEIRGLRKTNLELLFCQHQEECFDCVSQYNCQLLKLAKEYKVKINKWPDRKKDFPVYKFANALQFDSSKCIDCGNCIEMCHKQGVDYLIKGEKNTFHQVMPNPNRDCTFCGQCLVHCPVGAFEAIGEFEEINEPLKNKDKVVIFQIAPAVRTSIGEEFGLRPGQVLLGQIAAGLKQLGANKVFDVSVGADFTTYEEAGELARKIEKGQCQTLFSSCCPAWVRFLELYHPEFVGNLATARPPHIISGGLIKTYFAKKEKIDPKNIIVVSVMPCCAKKYEITRKEMLIDGLAPVDYVLTTRELAFLFLRNKIDLAKIKPIKLDNPLGDPSGAGVIYGASGGVMESALRTAFSRLNNGKKIDLDFKQVRGQEQIKHYQVEAMGKKLNLLAINGTGTAGQILKELKEQPGKYDCIEVMACLGGCVGGGGQPMLADKETRTARAQGLYDIDAKSKNRLANENPIVKEIYENFLTTPQIIQKICHVKYKIRSTKS